MALKRRIEIGKKRGNDLERKKLAEEGREGENKEFEGKSSLCNSYFEDSMRKRERERERERERRKRKRGR
ncbi:hypothetical protein Y032_0058g2859 [Ancylostoma ceylanicum]|uniref:Uncharacterized protein n=1 Tax=Ancylostoma ceylanicum TaxID=53326 RepID=A0A016U4T6_9BILA|nr:hypothetical protein Y032_0058g2859 [Ancylostoma ceylanicum]